MKHTKQVKSALIVGCGGIGSHIAMVLRNKFPGKKIYLADRVAPAIGEHLGNTQFITVDLSKDDISVLKGLDIDTLVFAAGIGRLNFFSAISADEIKKNFSVNCVSAIKLIKLYYDKLLSKSDFYCAVITSIAGMVASPLYSVYSATKGALVKFIEAANAELSYIGSPNKILDIAPGFIGGTGFHGGACTVAEEDNLVNLSEAMVKAMLRRDDVYIPKFDETYSRVLNSYNANPAAFATDSLIYKLKNNKLDEKPQITVGYLTGTFDLFHIGHLNVLRNSKRYCDKLIVGIHPDGKHKNKEVFIPLEERMEIVRNIKYVDDVMVCTNEDIDAYPELKFDYLFVGSDYKGTERFRRYEEYLADKGAKVIYLPYTQSTNSTYLRELISQRLIGDKK